MNGHKVAEPGVAVNYLDLPMTLGYPMFLVMFVVIFVKQCSVLISVKGYIILYSEFYGFYILFFNII